MVGLRNKPNSLDNLVLYSKNGLLLHTYLIFTHTTVNAFSHPVDAAKQK